MERDWFSTWRTPMGEAIPFDDAEALINQVTTGAKLTVNAVGSRLVTYAIPSQCRFGFDETL